MIRWVLSGMGALVLIGCPSQGEYACSDASMCIVGAVAGQCQSTGFCSFPDTTCPSGQRYGEFAGAGLGDDCVPDDPADTESGTSGSSDTTTGQPATSSSTDPSTSDVTTSVTTVSGSGPISASAEDSSSGGGETWGTWTGSSGSSGTASGSTSDSGEIVAPPCADFNFGDVNMAGADLPDITMYGDDFPQSCLPGNHADVVFYWVAPDAGVYEFYVDVDPSLGIDAIGALWDGCDGKELVCDDDGGEVIDSRIVTSAVPGQEFLWVVNAYGEVDAGFTVSITPL